MKVLLLDDDERFRSQLSPVLLEAGHRVVEARTAAEGTRAVDDEPLDVVVVEGLLSDTSGLSWIEALRERQLWMPAVFVSAHASLVAAAERTALDLYVQLVLKKPVEPKELVRRIEALRSVRPTASAAPSVQPDTADGGDLAGAMDELELVVDRACAGGLVDNGNALLLACRLHEQATSLGRFALASAAGRLEELLAGPRTADLAGSLRAALAEARRAAAPFRGSLVTLTGGGSHVERRVVVLHEAAQHMAHIRASGHATSVDLLCFRDPDEAIAAARDAEPAAVLVQATGRPARVPVEVIARLRATPGCERTPIGVVAPSASLRARLTSVRAGAAVVVDEPLDADGWMAAVRHLVAMQPARRPRVLLLDDSPSQANVVELLQGADVQVAGVAHPSRLYDELSRVHPDLLLIRGVVGGIAAADLCRAVRAAPAWIDLPVVVLAAPRGSGRLACFEAGADDFVQHLAMPTELVARIEGRVARARAQRERCDRDPLTQLPLRRAFQDVVSRRLSECARHGRHLSLVLLDVDRFKAVNDRYGHVTGDRVLEAFGRTLAIRLRTEDLRARWGGEEFVVALPETSRETAHAIVSRILEEIAATDFLDEPTGERFRVSFSAGIATHAIDGVSFADLLQAADRRLYLAKAAGRARVVAED